jgi:hypothetical protein
VNSAVKKFMLASVPALAVLGSNACGGSTQVEVVKTQSAVTGEWVRVNPPSDFGDIASGCVAGFRVFLSQDDMQSTSAIAVIADPSCEEHK